jgi:hypothetical protein
MASTPSHDAFGDVKDDDDPDAMGSPEAVCGTWFYLSREEKRMKLY